MVSQKIRKYHLWDFKAHLELSCAWTAQINVGLIIAAEIPVWSVD